jgi:hypothetical protein
MDNDIELYLIKKEISPEKKIHLETALREFDRISFPVKQELDALSSEQLKDLIKSFQKISNRPAEILFLQTLIALKMTTKHLEITKARDDEKV